MQAQSTKETEPERPVSVAGKLERLHRLMDKLDERERDALSAVVAAGATGVQVSTMARKFGIKPGSFGGITRAIRVAAIEVGIDPDHAIESVHGLEVSRDSKFRRSGTTLRSRLGVDVEQTPRDEIQAVLDKIRTNTTKSAFMALVEAGSQGIESPTFAKLIGLRTNGEGIGPVLHAIRGAARRASVDPLVVVVTSGSNPMVVSTRLVMPDTTQEPKSKSNKTVGKPILTMNESRIVRLLTDVPQTAEALASVSGMGVVTLTNVAKRLTEKRLARFFPGLGYKRS